MNKFTEQISDTSNQTLKRRASAIAQGAELAQQDIINSLKKEHTELTLKIANLTDLAPDTNDSLRPGSKDWDANKWAQELQETKQKLYFLEIQLKLAQETYDEFFAETKKKS